MIYASGISTVQGKRLPRQAAAPEAGASGSPRPGDLKIVHVVLSLDVGGLERNVVNQVRESPRLKQEVMILCLETRGQLAPRAESLGAKVVCLNKPAGLCWRLMAQVEGVLRDFGPGVVHTHQLASLLYGGRGARRAGVPLVVHTEHGREDYAARWKTRWLGRIAGGYAQRFYCLTQDMAQALRKHRIVEEGKIQVIHNGIDSAPYVARHDTRALRESLGIPPGAPVIGTVGRLTEIKRQDVLLRGFARLLQRHTEAHLVLVGEGPLRGPLEELARSLGMAQRVRFTGYQAHTAPYLQIMDVFVLSSRSEGLPQAGIEASFAGVPVVGSRVGGLPELVEDGRTGILFEPGCVAELTEAMHVMLTDRPRVQRLVAAARERVTARYEIRRMAEEYHDYYVGQLSAGGGGVK